MDPKTATKLDEVDLLKLQNLALRRQLLDAELNGAVTAIAAKYKGDGEDISVSQDTGEIIRTPGAPKAP